MDKKTRLYLTYSMGIYQLVSAFSPWFIPNVFNGKFVLASMNRGIIESGRTSEIIVNSASKNELIQIQKTTYSPENLINADDLSSYELNRQIKIKLS